MRKDLELLFPTPIGIIQLDDLSICKQHASEVLQQIDNSFLEKHGVWTTDDSLHNRPEFESLTRLIDEQAQEFFKDIVGLKDNSLVMSNMWANVHKSGSKHHIHQHPNSYFSGVIYLHIPQGNNVDEGKLFFVDPRTAKNMTHADFTKESPLSYRTWWFTPEVGKLLFFPSWLEHGTEPCVLPKDEFRISLSFNYILTKSTTSTMKLNLKSV